jgi:hypothetical protein
MTDEQLGRAWAAKQSTGCVPQKVCTGKYLWYDAYGNGYPHFESWLVVMLDHDFYSSESESYAALGAAIRKLWAFADQSRADVQGTSA